MTANPELTAVSEQDRRQKLELNKLQKRSGETAAVEEAEATLE